MLFGPQYRSSPESFHSWCRASRSLQKWISISFTTPSIPLSSRLIHSIMSYLCLIVKLCSLNYTWLPMIVCKRRELIIECYLSPDWWAIRAPVFRERPDVAIDGRKHHISGNTQSVRCVQCVHRLRKFCFNYIRVFGSKYCNSIDISRLYSKPKALYLTLTNVWYAFDY